MINLLVGEVTSKHGDKTGIGGRIIIGREPLFVLAVLHRPKEGVGRFGIALQSFVDRVMVEIEDIETAL